jgi:hypothetical protein
VVSCVIFDDPLEAEKTAIRIKELRRKLKKSDRFEFKFNKCSRKIRKNFLETVSGSKFRIRAIVVQKELIRSPELKSKKGSFYGYTLKLLLKHNTGTIKNAKIRIDGSGNRMFRRELFVYLRKSLPPKTIKNIKTRDSKKDVLIQLSDMVAGTINRKYSSNKKDSEIYWNIIKKRRDDIWIFK